eukprot:scaffold564437_cov17-Prasinocladus_malaysianus.AAC.1
MSGVRAYGEKIWATHLSDFRISPYFGLISSAAAGLQVHLSDAHIDAQCTHYGRSPTSHHKLQTSLMLDESSGAATRTRAIWTPRLAADA